jgi:ribonuclease HII
MMICGVDEAGRGPWAGPVVAAAVLCPATGADGRIPAEVADSKTLSERCREALFEHITHACLYGVGQASPAEIDRLNIRRATHLAMYRAVCALPIRPHRALVDGNDAPLLPVVEVQTLVGGDGLIPAISAASIIAKVTRDRLMQAADALYPGYGFAAHKGYGVKAHAQALQDLGPCPIHRFSFRPVALAAEKPANPQEIAAA